MDPEPLILHYPDETKSRGQYHKMLAQAVKEDPYDDRNMHYYARELWYAGQFEAAIETFTKHLALPKSTWKAERAASMGYMAYCYARLGNNAKYLEWLERATEEHSNRDNWTQLAQGYYDVALWDKCAQACEKALSFTEKTYDYLNLQLPWEGWPEDLYSIALWHLGDKAKGYEMAKKALEFQPENERIKSNIAWFEDGLARGSS
jgi:tetratricopeptide (TPR) repeat protein